MTRDRPDASFRLRLAAAAAPIAMVLGVLAVYCPIELFEGGTTLTGADFQNLHERRIRYAQEGLSSEHPYLPAWYTRELLGSPFWSNVQSFPFLPTRLALLWLDPHVLFPVSVNLAAVLAAVFTYLFARRLGLRPLAAAAAGWTFSASGYFASRVLAGYLPLIEVFWALPLLLWIVEGIARSDASPGRARLLHLGLALAGLSISLAGHPQIPAYAIATAALYAAVRLRLRALRTGLAMLAGVGLSAFVWWPMLNLIGRSARMLVLERPESDVRFPFWRLKAFVVPWADGWAPIVARSPAREFVDPTAIQLFWDTVCYVGLLPLLAALVLAVRALWTRRRPGAPWVFLAVVGCGALLLALPILPLREAPGTTLLRSPSRLLYLTTFALAMGTGACLELLLRIGAEAGRRWVAAAAALALAAHAVDLAAHDRPFLVCWKPPPQEPERIERWRREIGDRRVAFDYDGHFALNRQVDDIGFFDSIVLARPYRAFLALIGARESANVQTIDGALLPAPVLAGLGVEWVLTKMRREDLELHPAEGPAKRYRVPDPASRVTFAPDAAVRFLEEEAILQGYREKRARFRREILLPPAARPADFADGAAPAETRPTLRYERPDSDRMVIGIRTEGSGFVRILEAWDEGWSATLDGRPAGVLLADAFAMAVRVPPGEHEIRLTYRTPGAGVGLAVSALGAALLAVLLLRGRLSAPRASSSPARSPP